MWRSLVGAMFGRIHRDRLQHAHRQVTFGFNDYRGKNFEQGS
jgi:hypothetical protein